MKILIALLFIFSSLNAGAAGFDLEKSKLGLSVGTSEDLDSKKRSGTVSWDLEWHFEDPENSKLFGTKVVYSSKPYIKYEDEKLLSSRKKTTKVGLDAVKLAFVLGEKQAWKPFFTVGFEDSEIRTIEGSSVKKDEELLTTFGFGIAFEPEGHKLGIEIYTKNKYTDFFENKTERESGIAFTWNFATKK